MSDSDRWQQGEKTIKDVYAGDVITPPKGMMAFSDIMLEQLFAELWTRDTLSMRDKRILLLGIIAEKGEPNTFKIQAKASLIYALGRLQPTDRFNVIRFDNTMDMLFTGAVPADRAHVRRATDFVGALRAEGGT